MSAVKQQRLFACRSEQHCPGGEAEVCGSNREKIACGVCRYGFVEDGTGSCEPCAAVPWWSTVLTLAGAVTALALRTNAETRDIAEIQPSARPQFSSETMTISHHHPSGHRTSWVGP